MGQGEDFGWRGHIDSKRAKREDTKRRTIRRYSPVLPRQRKTSHLHTSTATTDLTTGYSFNPDGPRTRTHTHTTTTRYLTNLISSPPPSNRPMSPYTYEPTAPKVGFFFATGPASPNAFAGFHQSATPIGSVLGKVLIPSSAQNVPSNSNFGGTFTLKNVLGKRN